MAHPYGCPSAGPRGSFPHRHPATPSDLPPPTSPSQVSQAVQKARVSQNIRGGLARNLKKTERSHENGRGTRRREKRGKRHFGGMGTHLDGPHVEIPLLQLLHRVQHLLPPGFRRGQGFAGKPHLILLSFPKKFYQFLKLANPHMNLPCATLKCTNRICPAEFRDGGWAPTYHSSTQA